MKMVKSLSILYTTRTSSVHVGMGLNLAMECSVQGAIPNGQHFAKNQTMSDITDTETPTIPAVPVRVLAVASSGGHWQELLRLRPALEGCEQHFAGIDPGWELSVTPHPFYMVPDTHFDEPLKTIITFFCLLRLFRKIRPHVVLSTGAGPGGLAMLLGRIFRARTLWVDSAANCNALSLSGRMSFLFAHKVLTQSPHLAKPDGPYYRGSLLP